MQIQEGDRAPDFKVMDDQGNWVEMADYKGRKLVLYFYPKDDTPGCTTEACDLRDNFQQLNQLQVSVLGVSRDSVKSHQKFKEKYDLNFPLLSDEDESLCKAYDVIQEQNMYGRIYIGIERSTFLIDEKGIVRKAWRKVKVAGHVEEIIAAIREMD